MTFDHTMQTLAAFVGVAGLLVAIWTSLIDVPTSAEKSGAIIVHQADRAVVNTGTVGDVIVGD